MLFVQNYCPFFGLESANSEDKEKAVGGTPRARSTLKKSSRQKPRPPDGPFSSQKPGDLQETGGGRAACCRQGGADRKFFSQNGGPWPSFCQASPLSLSFRRRALSCSLEKRPTREEGTPRAKRRPWPQAPPKKIPRKTAGPNPAGWLSWVFFLEKKSALGDGPPKKPPRCPPVGPVRPRNCVSAGSQRGLKVLAGKRCEKENCPLKPWHRGGKVLRKYYQETLLGHCWHTPGGCGGTHKIFIENAPPPGAC